MTENRFNFAGTIDVIKHFLSSNLDYILIIIALLFLLILLFKEKILSYFAKTDKLENFTENYTLNNQLLNQKFDQLNNLNHQEKLKLSWKFLSDIVAYVKNFFSKEDKAIVHKAGNILKKHGVKYIHVVEEELYTVAKKQQNLSLSKSNSQTSLQK